MSEFDEHTHKILNWLPESDKKKPRAFRHTKEKFYDSDSDDDVNIVMEVEDPVIELNEFAWIDRKKKLPNIPSSPEYTRKRSYSKEDVKIGLTILDNGTISPEFIISDEDEYDADSNSKVECEVKEAKNSETPIYRKSLTGPSSANNKNMREWKSKHRKGTYSPTKYTKYTWNTCYSSNLHSEYEAGGHLYCRRKNIINKISDDLKDEVLPLKLNSWEQVKEASDAMLNFESCQQYEKVIYLLMQKVQGLRHELKVSKEVCKQQNNLIKTYKIKNEDLSQQNIKIVHKAMKATKTVKALAEQSESEFENWQYQIQKLIKENELLSKIRLCLQYFIVVVSSNINWLLIASYRRHSKDKRGLNTKGNKGRTSERGTQKRWL